MLAVAPLAALLLLATGCKSNEYPGPFLFGTWRGVTEEGQVQTFEFRIDETATWRIETDELDVTYEVVYRWRPDRYPAHLDLTAFGAGPLRGRTLYGIMQFEGDDGRRFRWDCEVGPETGGAYTRPRTFTVGTLAYDIQSQPLDAKTVKQMEKERDKALAAMETAGPGVPSDPE